MSRRRSAAATLASMARVPALAPFAAVPFSGSPFAAWSRLAFRTGEMMLASSEVIANRSARMLVAGANPSSHDRAELALMVQEKMDASVECTTAVASHSLTQGMRGAGRFWADAWRLNLDLAMLATSTTPTQAMRRLSRTLTSSTLAFNRLASDAVEVSEKALAPLHRRTAANVRRLGRKR